ncbi:hypothetical protein BJY04DRAFT_6672 [Aspergillus karnatakaensis]|uniref:uncharacterized protein n=1 Tax=Aspergillus karnatakaensis TaxID=1810916 RepID=UPI003CCE102F
MDVHFRDLNLLYLVLQSQCRQIRTLLKQTVAPPSAACADFSAASPLCSLALLLLLARLTFSSGRVWCCAVASTHSARVETLTLVELSEPTLLFLLTPHCSFSPRALFIWLQLSALSSPSINSPPNLAGNHCFLRPLTPLHWSHTLPRCINPHTHLAGHSASQGHHFNIPPSIHILLRVDCCRARDGPFLPFERLNALDTSSAQGYRPGVTPADRQALSALLAMILPFTI